MLGRTSECMPRTFAVLPTQSTGPHVVAGKTQPSVCLMERTSTTVAKQLRNPWYVHLFRNWCLCPLRLTSGRGVCSKNIAMRAGCGQVCDLRATQGRNRGMRKFCVSCFVFHFRQLRAPRSRVPGVPHFKTFSKDPPHSGTRNLRVSRFVGRNGRTRNAKSAQRSPLVTPPSKV